jgi:putative membrane protein
LVREGLFVRETRHVPFARVQAVNERQGPLHRLLGVTELVLESGSAGTPEAVMRVLGVAEAARIAAVLRSAAATTGSDPDVTPEAGVTSSGAAPMRDLLRIPTDELVLHGIISNRGLVVIALATGVISQNTDLLDLLPIDLKQLLTDGADIAAGVSVGAIVGALLALLLGFLVFVRLLSIAYAIVTLHGFTLRRGDDRLRVNRGLLSRVDLSGRVSGFQRIVLRQSLLHRVFRRSAMTVDLAGAAFMDGQGEATDARLDTLAPIATAAQTQALLDEFAPGTRLDALDWRPLHRGAALRRWQETLYWLLPSLAAVVAAAAWIPDAPRTPTLVATVLTVVALITSAWHARQWARWSAFAATDRVVVFRSGVWSRHWTLVFDDRAQSTTLRRSPRDRRQGTASLTVDVQSMTLDHALRVPYLDVMDAERLNARFWQAGTSSPAPAGTHAGDGLR